MSPSLNLHSNTTRNRGNLGKSMNMPVGARSSLPGNGKRYESLTGGNRSLLKTAGMSLASPAGAFGGASRIGNFVSETEGLKEMVAKEKEKLNRFMEVKENSFHLAQ